jgi:gliding motility-associated-like protein
VEAVGNVVSGIFPRKFELLMKLTMYLSSRRLLAIFLFVFALLGQNRSFAQTLPAAGSYSGGEFTAAMNGTGDSLILTMKAYYNCPTTAVFPPSIFFTKQYSGCGGFQTDSLFFVNSVEISDVCAASLPFCGTSATLSGERMVTYVGTIALSPEVSCGTATYSVFFSDRTNSSNLIPLSPDRVRPQLVLNLATDSLNNTPVFGANERPFVCGGVAVGFDPQVTEVDGDSLVFSFRPAQGGGIGPTNYTYVGGFSATDPTGNGMTIDPETGILNFTAPASGIFQVVIEVDEYDRATGALISTSFRDFQFEVDATCTNAGPSVAAAFSATANIASSSGNDTIVVDIGSAASWSLVFTGGAGEVVTLSTNAGSALNGAIVSSNTAGTSTTHTVSWTPGAGDVGTHVYSVAAIDNGCDVQGRSAQKIVVVVQESTAPVAIDNVVVQNETCAGSEDGQLTVNISGGVGPFAYRIVFFSGSLDTVTQSSNVFTNLAPLSYNVYVIDSSDFSQDSATVTVLPGINFFAAGFNSILAACDTVCNGRARALTLFGGNPKTYLWDDGNTLQTNSTLCGGLHSVTITEATNGCEVVQEVVIPDGPVIFAAVDSTDSATCNGGNDGAAFLSAHGGYAASTSTASYIIDQTEDTYEPYPFNFSGATVYDHTTFTTFGAAWPGGDEGLSAVINIGFPFEFFGNSFTQFRIHANGYITFDVANPTNSESFNQAAIPNAAYPNNWVGFWEDLDLSVGGSVESYEIGSGNQQAHVINFIDVPRFANNAQRQTYQIVLYESSNIVQIYAEDVTIATAVQGMEGSGGTSGIAVPGRNGGNININNDYVAFIPETQNFTYNWSSIGTGSSATNLTAGTYTVTVSDPRSCNDILSFDIFEPTPIVIDTNITEPLCAGESTGSIEAIPSGSNGGPFTFSWSTGATTALVTNLAAGNYTVTVTDVEGCTETLTVTLTDPAPVVASITIDNPIECNGGATGELTATGTGGTAPYTFSWSTAQTTPTITNLAAGAYTVTITDVNGCTGTNDITITEPTAVDVSIATISDVNCVGGNDGSITANAATGGTPVYTYLWSNGQTTLSITNLVAGTYTITATDANGCTDTAQATITAPTTGVEVTIASVTDVDCNGNTTGAITANTPTGGTAPYTFLWSNGGTAITATGLAAGTYTITATDANGCTDTAQATVSEPIVLDVDTTSTTNPSCATAFDGSISVAGTGGTPAYTFAWSSGGNAATESGLGAGTYTVTVTDLNGCTATLSATLTAPAAILVNVTVDNNVDCFGGNDGQLTAIPAGGSAPFTFAWSSGGTAATETNLIAGTYTVTVTDVSGCTGTASGSITEPASAVVASIASSNDVNCAGGNDGDATAAAAGGTPGYTFLWSNGANTAFINNLAAGTYSVTVTDLNGCTDSASVTINAPVGGVDVTIATITDVDCNGNATGAITANTPTGGTAPYTFIWSNGGTALSNTGLVAGTYTITVTDANGCTDTASATVSEPNALLVFTNKTDETCAGAADGVVNSTVSGGTTPYSFLWSNGATSQNINGLAAGTYTVTVTDINGCTATDSRVVDAGVAVILTMSSIDEQCPGSNSGSAMVEANGGTTPYTFLWNNGGTTDSISGLAAGTYTVTVTDANGCTATDLVAVGVGTGIEVNVSVVQDPACAGGNTGSIAVSAVNASLPTNTSFLWNTGSTLNILFSLSAGTYTVTLTDNNTGCTDTAQVILTDPPAVVANIIDSVQPSCDDNDGELEVEGTGGTPGYTFLWSTGATAAQITGLAAGTYTVTVTDANGCTGTTQSTLVAPAGFVANGQMLAADTCGNSTGSVTVNMVGGSLPFNFSWSGGQITQTIAGLAAGTYTVTVTDADACTDTAQVAVIDTCACTLVASGVVVNNVSCFGGNDGSATVQITGGIAPFTYSWSNGSTADTAANLVVGTYTVTVTAADGCTDTASVLITQPLTAVSASITSTTPPTCFGGDDGQATVVAANGTAPYTYLWTSGETAASAINLSAGLNTVTVTDANGCTTTASTTLGNGTAVNVNMVTTNSLCFVCSGTATASISGGTAPYVYSWSTSTIVNTGSASNQQSSLCAGPYGVTITDANGCADSSSANVTDIFTPPFTLSATDPSCFGECDGSITATFTCFGCEPFRWYAGVDTTNLIGTGNTITGLCAGTYLARLTTGFGCNRYDTIILNEPDQIILTTTSVDAGCTSPTGQASVSATGGVAPYTFLWSNGSTNATITGVVAGTYTVTVTDNSTCTETAIVTVNSTVGHTASTALINDALCFNEATGAAFATQVGGTAPFTYAWSNGALTDTLSNVLAGTYTVTITDASGCTDTASVVIDEPDSLSFTFTEVPISCTGAGNDGSITVSVSGGTGASTFLWNTGATTATITNLTAGTYCVTATDANGCTNDACYILNPPGSFSVSIIDSGDVTCAGGNDGFAEVGNFVGGSGNYTFSWSNGATTAIASSLVAGTYTVTVLDQITGCEDITQVSIDAPSPLIVVIDSVSNVNCLGGSDGVVCAIASGGTAPYTFLWSNGATSNPCISSLLAGTYTITITDANGCTVTTDTIVTEPGTGLVAAVNINTQPACNGDSATVVASATGGSGIYSFLWPNGATSSTVELPAGTYCVTVSDGGACTDTACVIITDPAVVTANITASLPSCPTGNDGSLTASGSGGDGGPYTFLWDDNSTNPVRNGLSAGNYTVTVTDGNGCTGIGQFNLTDPPGMTATFNNINVSSCGTCNGSATVNVSGGASPLSFAWPSGSTNSTGTGLCAGLNTVTVTDGNGCVDSFDVNIGSLGADTVFAGVLQNVTCAGGNDGIAFADYVCNVAPCTVAWFDLNTSTLQGTTDTITGLSAGEYYVQLTNDSGCISFDTITITEPTAVVASITGSIDVTCPGNNDGSASAAGAGGAGGYTFIWSNGATGATANNLPTGNYCVTVTDASGCTDTACVTIGAPLNSVSVTGVVINDVTCFGGNDGSVTAIATGGTPPYNFLWNGTLVADTLNNQPAGTYIVQVTDAAGCFVFDTVEVDEPSPVGGTFSNVIDPSCPSLNDGEATITGTGGAGGYTYLWPSGGTSATETNLNAGQYCVTITDANGCADTACVIITDPAPIQNNFTAVGNSSCTVCDGTATANPSGGNGPVFTFAWSNGGTSAINTNLCAGVNTVTITDAGGCSRIFGLPINADGADTVIATKVDPSCGNCDGIVIANYNCTQAPCTVEWTNLVTSAVVGTTDTVTGLCAGTYAVELTNGGSCVSVDTITLVAPALINPGGSIADVTCAGNCDGSITLNVTGGSGTYTFNWSTSATTSSINGLCAGSYTVTISDGAGCDTKVSFNVDEPTFILPNAVVNDASCFASCDGQITTAPTGGAGGYTFNWSPVPANGNGTSQATGLCAGTYFLTITDANGCATLDTYNIAEPPAIVQNAVDITDATCGICNGSVSPEFAGGAGGFTYLWSNGATTDTIANLCFGGYSVTVTDISGCTADFIYPVSETDGPEINISSINVSAAGECDGEATANVISSLGAVTFSWSNGDLTATADTLCAGTYFVTATDTNGCSTVDTVTITEPTALLLTFNVSEISCAGNGCDGAVEAIVAGGVPPYSYLWNTGDTTALIDSLCVGVYTVTITDENGAQITDSVELTAPQPFNIASVVNDVSCPGLCDGDIALNVTGGVPPYNYLWNTGDTTSSLANLCQGVYSVTIIDTAFCSVSIDFNVNEPPAIVLNTTSVTNPDCQQNNGAVTVAASGGNGGPFNYQWLDVNNDPLVPNQTGPSATNLAAGIYNVRVQDGNGCEDTLAVILNNLNAPVITLDTLINASCFGECDGSIATTISGGVAPLNIFWSNGDITDDIDSLCAGNDTVTVVDADLCLAFAIYTIAQPTEIVPSEVVIADVVCGADCNGSISVSMTGGQAPYAYLWSNGASDSIASNLCAGDYGLTVTDANGCTFTTTLTVGGPQPMVITLDSLDDATCNNTGDGSIAITVTGGSAPYSYQWNYDNLDTLTAADLNGVLAGGYGLTVTDAFGCTVSDSFNIGIEFDVRVTAMDDFSVCPRTQGVVITGSVTGASSTRWLNGDGTIAGGGSTVTVNTNAQVSVFVLEGISDVCVARDTLRISWTPGPGIDAGNDRAIEPGQSTTIGGSPTAREGVEVVWTPAENLSSVTALNPEANPLETTVYYVSATDNDGCFGLDSVIVTVEEVVDPVGGFSPNGDGVNDFFVVDRIEDYPNAVVQIFNRWGNLIFESPSGYTTPWNGKYQGKDLPVGTYYYVIDLKDPAIKRLVTGPVTILK